MLAPKKNMTEKILKMAEETKKMNNEVKTQTIEYLQEIILQRIQEVLKTETIVTEVTIETNYYQIRERIWTGQEGQEECICEGDIAEYSQDNWAQIKTAVYEIGKVDGWESDAFDAESLWIKF